MEPRHDLALRRVDNRQQLLRLQGRQRVVACLARHLGQPALKVVLRAAVELLECRRAAPIKEPIKGGTVPAQRTLYMVSVVALLLCLNRFTSASRVLALALLAVLLLDPWAVLAPGFWLSFGAVAGVHYNDLLPLPYTRECADHLVARIGAVQDVLKRPILVENASCYLRYRVDEMDEVDFVADIARRAEVSLADFRDAFPSKGAVLALTKAMAVDELPYGIRVNCVSPGTVWSPWVERLTASSRSSSGSAAPRSSSVPPPRSPTAPTAR